MSYDPTNKEGFERWATEEGFDLSPAVKAINGDTYWDDTTEYAWRGWANRPHRETRVHIAGVWPTPERKAQMSPAFAAPYGVRAEGVMGIPPNPPGSGSAKASDALTWNVRIDGGDDTAIREAAARAAAEMPDLADRVDHIDDAGYVHWKTSDDKTLKDCAARFPVPPDAFPAFPKVADTVHVGSPPCENFAGENFRKAVRALVDRLPKNPETLASYFLTHTCDELLAVRKLLGDE